MKWSTAGSTARSLRAAADEAAAAVGEDLGSADADLTLAFVSPHHRDAWDELDQQLGAHFPDAVRLGCSGGGTIGGGQEIENGPSFSLAAASLPGVELRSFHLPADAVPDVEHAERKFPKLLGLAKDDGNPTVLLLPEPFSCPVERLVAGLDRWRDGRGTLVGGLASGARKAGQNALFKNGGPVHDGAVGVTMSGDIATRTVVAQGCRPIGNPMFVTECARHVITAIDGNHPVKALEELFDDLPPEDRALMQTSLFIGIVMRPGDSRHGPGDFLIRNIAGIDPASGALIVGAELEPGQVVQFHLRDATTSAADLEHQLASCRDARDLPPGGALLFSCLGRGVHLYGQPNHDSMALQRSMGPLPTAGFFCNGEIGPVRGQSFVHGYTSVFALFSRCSG